MECISPCTWHVLFLYFVRQCMHSCIEPSLHGVDFFQKSFYGDFLSRADFPGQKDHILYSDLVYTFIFVLSFFFLLFCVRLSCMSAWVCITADDLATCLVLHSVQVHESKQVHHNDGIRLPADDHIVDFSTYFCISFNPLFLQVRFTY